ncbi:hypothetical protein BDY21DRAFT_281410 [Lineolata rhizophorae]|uniref:F-box domain-containing protein n=1 Tax=Lineolata rhizophorae TaxID=578093 RepID=A0A6A6P7X0_9PEZI|nr:hypothetical protein BDY21DRAFT_281410 [Lineolata rhizophorae]
MHINEFPYEILSNILEEASRLEERDGVAYTFGLSQAPQPGYKAKLQRYVRGPLRPDMLRWDATASIRRVCPQWHQWAIEYAMREVYIRRWQGSERWAELPQQRDKYSLYELVDKPSGTAVYRDPYRSLRHTVKLLERYPELAAKVRRIWFDGFYVAETDVQICSALHACSSLQSVTMPWTTLRHLSGREWKALLGLGPTHTTPLRSLELLAVDLPARQAQDAANQYDERPLETGGVNFSQLRRLKIFGNTDFMPVCDRDLHAISRTATQLEHLHVTGLSTVTVDGVMALVKSSRATIRTLEHSPRADAGFRYPHPGHAQTTAGATAGATEEHLCEVLTSCPRLTDLSVSLPSMCAALFANRGVRWRGDCQVRAAHLCPVADHRPNNASADALAALADTLAEARGLVAAKAASVLPDTLNLELFYSDVIFEPHAARVHGDFALAEVSAGGRWPGRKGQSRKGPYGTTGLYGKDEGEMFEMVNEEVYLEGVRRGFVGITA